MLTIYPGSPEYILCLSRSTSVTPVSLYTHRCSSTIYLEAAIELVWRCMWRPESSELRVNLEPVIDRVWRSTRRL